MHPFDRYADFTDLQALKEASAQPLRKSLRVNTLKSSVEEFKEYAKEQGWQLEEVPWCKEGFFIDREDRSHALGKDLRHLLGHFYMQEASSMLPVELLDPQPGEEILDMSAAPGSKTTQIAGRMQQEGVIIANDMAEKRLWTLKSALHRSGVLNVLITKKVGQWFGANMTERFDRVLCDAPCTAQGTIRKDSTALDYSSEHGIGKAAKLQRELLESAIHATKVGGRVVYSTCTLTPEENEEVVLGLLNKYCDQLEVVDVSSLALGSGSWDNSKAVDDSYSVQKSLPNISSKSQKPLLRIWPQTYNTEGFFCAVFKKTASTKNPEPVDWVDLQEESVSKNMKIEMAHFLEKNYGTPFILEDERLFQREDHFSITTKEVTYFKLPIADYSLGLPLGKKMRDMPVLIDHEIATLRGGSATEHVCDIDDEQLSTLLKGGDCSCPDELLGHVLVRYRGMCIGKGKARDGKLKNHLPRWLVQVCTSL